MDPTQLSEEASDLLFAVRRSIRYHRSRENWFDGMRAWLQFLTTLAGTATVAVVVNEIGSKGLETGVALLVALLTTLDQVMRTARKARIHSALAVRFCQLEREMARIGPAVLNARLNDFTAQRLEIEQDEPPVLRVLDVICHNELCRAMGLDKSAQVKVGAIQRALCQVCDFRRDKLLA